MSYAPPWDPGTPRTDEYWKWWYDPATTMLYCPLSSSQWQRRRARRIQRGARQQYEAPTNILATRLPQGLRRATVHTSFGSPFVSLICHGNSSDPVVAEVDSIQMAITQLPPEQKWSIHKLKAPDGGLEIAHAISTGTAVAVSDGSLKSNVGTSAFILVGPSDAGQIVGVNQVPGKVNDGDSHRCELSGIYGIVTTVHVVTSVHNVPSGHVTVVCDNEQALRVFEPDYFPDPKGANFDLVHALWTLIRNSPIRWSATHVHGHQERNVRWSRLSRHSRLNVAMDKIAKQFWRHLIHSHSGPPPQPDIRIHGEGWQIWRGTRKITQPTIDALYDEIQDDTTQMWWVRHGLLDHSAKDEVDWEATSAMMHQALPAERRYLTKAASHNCGIGVTQVKWKFQQDAKCPRCGAHEDAKHVLRCHGDQADDTWSTNISKLKEYLIETDTSPELQSGLIRGLEQWRAGSQIPLTQCSQPCVQFYTNKNLLDGISFLKVSLEHIGASFSTIIGCQPTSVGQARDGCRDLCCASSALVVVNGSIAMTSNTLSSDLAIWKCLAAFNVKS